MLAALYLNDLSTNTAHELCEFTGDNTAAEDDDFLGYKIELKYVVTCPIGSICESANRWHGYGGASGHHKVVGREARAIVELNSARVDELSAIAEQGKAVALKLLLAIIGKFFDHIQLALMKRWHVD